MLYLKSSNFLTNTYVYRLIIISKYRILIPHNGSVSGFASIVPAEKLSILLNSQVDYEMISLQISSYHISQHTAEMLHLPSQAMTRGILVSKFRQFVLERYLQFYLPEKIFLLHSCICLMSQISPFLTILTYQSFIFHCTFHDTLEKDCREETINFSKTIIDLI